MKKIFLFSSLFCVACSGLFAQRDLGLSFSQTLFQTNQANPAFLPERKIIVALPSVHAAYYNTFGGLVVENNATRLNKTGSDESVNLQMHFNTIGLGVAIKDKGFATLSHNLVTDVQMGGSSDLFRVLVEGNAPFIGKTIDVAPKINVLSHSEIALGYAHQITPKLSAGAKLKILGGFVALKTAKNSKTTLTTSADVYQLAFETDYTLQASAASFSTNPNTDLLLGLTGTSSSTKGIALDLGANYALNDKITLSASMLNLGGKLTWKNGFNQTSKGSFNLDGLDISSVINADSTFSADDVVNIDSIFTNQLGFASTNASFSTRLPFHFNLMGSYKVSEYCMVNALLSPTSRGTAFALNTTFRVKNFLETGITYSIRNRSFSDLGTNLAFNLGGFQAYIVLDNFLAMAKPLQAHNLTARVGVNLNFGNRIKKEEN